MDLLLLQCNHKGYFHLSVTLFFMFNYFRHIPIFETTIPTAKPHTIQSFPMSQSTSPQMLLFEKVNKSQSSGVTDETSQRIVKLQILFVAWFSIKIVHEKIGFNSSIWFAIVCYSHRSFSCKFAF